MAIDFTIIAKIAQTVYDIYDKMKSWLDTSRKVSNEEIEKLILELMRSANQARIDIIFEIRDTRLADLIGDVNGIFIRLDEYTIYDKNTQYQQWDSEGERLREIIDDSAGVIGDLCAELDRLNLVNIQTLLSRISDIEHASNIYCLLSIIVPLRAIAMAERSRNYGTDDFHHIPSIWLNLKMQTAVMYAAIEYIVQNGFSKILTRRGEPVSRGKYIMFIGYEFINHFVSLFEAHQDNMGSAIQRAQVILNKRKENYLCSQTILVVKAEMEPHSFESLNYPGLFIRHQYFRGKITSIQSDLDEKDSSFKLVRGLADDSCVSFESTNYPGYFLRHRNFKIYLDLLTQDQLFKLDATFYKRNGLADSVYTSFESFNYPERFIRHKNFLLYLEPVASNLSKKDATFKIKPAL
jgi:hypothetical protein